MKSKNQPLFTFIFRVAATFSSACLLVLKIVLNSNSSQSCKNFRGYVLEANLFCTPSVIMEWLLWRSFNSASCAPYTYLSSCIIEAYFVDRRDNEALTIIYNTRATRVSVVGVVYQVNTLQVVAEAADPHLFPPHIFGQTFCYNTGCTGNFIKLMN